jgi:Cu/Ag efflux pump CusA
MATKEARHAIVGLLPLLVVRLHGTGIERPPAIAMIGGLVTSTVFALPAVPTLDQRVHGVGVRRRARPSVRS